MARLKKSLAMLLAFAMIFSTMSIAASAWKSDRDDDNDIRFTVQFFRKDAKGNWVNTSYDDPTTAEVENIFRAAPGEEVQARVYVETTFPTGAMTHALLFDETFFSQNLGSSDPYTDRTLTLNTDNAFYANLGLTGNSLWRSDETKFAANRNNKLIDYLLKYGYSDEDYIKKVGDEYQKAPFDKDYFAYTDLITTSYAIDGNNKNTVFPELAHNADGSIADSSKDSWMIAYELKVKNDERAVILDTADAPNKGYAKIPAIYAKQSANDTYSEDLPDGTSITYRMLVDYERGLETQGVGSTKSMAVWDNDPEFDTKAGYVSTTSYITFDPNGGKIDGSTENKTVAGIIGTSAKIDTPTKDDGSTFSGWKLISGEDNTTTFGYSNKVLQAMWTEPALEATEYTQYDYEMDVNGVYQLVNTTVKPTTEGQIISANTHEPKEGFYIDEETENTPEKSVLSITTEKDSSKNVLKVYYTRNAYTVKYVYVDNGDEKSQVEQPVYYGADVPEFTDYTADGKVPSANGKVFDDWKIEEGGQVVNSVPETVTDDITFTAQYKNEVYSYIFYAYEENDAEQAGSFDNGEKTIRLDFEFGADPEEVAAEIEKLVDDPSKPGYEFLEWENFSTTPTEDAHIYPIYNQSQYEVRFLDKDGNVIDDGLLFTYGEKVEGTHIPEGYKVNGAWTLKDSNETVNFPYTVTENVDFYAVDSANKYPANFYINGELYKTVYVPYDELIEVPEYTVPEGYDFTGWFDLEVDGEQFMDDVNGKDYYAELTPKTITLTFVIEGQEDTVITGNFGETVEGIPTIPAKEGYEPGIWNPSAPSTFPAKDATYTALWVPVVAEKHTLTLDPNGGTLKGSSEVFTEEYEEGTDIPPVVDPERPGYRFVRWVDEQGSTQSIPKKMPGNDVKLTAEWEQLYTVTYVNEDGSVYEEIANAGAAGENIPAPTKGNPSKDGFNFIKWVDATTGEERTTIPAGGVTLKPVFEEIIPDTYKITYVYKNAEVPAGAPKLPDPEFVEAGKTVTVAEVPELKGYEFSGWKYEGNLTESFVMPAKEVTIEGEWIVKEFNITLDANTGLFENGASQFVDKVEYGTELKNVIPAAPEKEGYSFQGWRDAAGNKVDIPATMPDEDINVKAEWKINSYEITFNSLGGSDVDPITLEYGAEIKDLPVPTKEGFSFKGWKDAEGNDLPATMPASDIEAVAKWEADPAIPVYDLTIDAGEGKFSDGKNEHSFEIAEGESLKVYLADKPSRDCYEFIGWYDEDGNKIDEETATMNGDVTISAEWKKVESIITYYLASGESVKVYDTKKIAIGDAIAHPADPALEGFTFEGWFDKDGNALPTVMGEEDLEAYAKFNINTYKVTYIANGETYAEYDVVYQAEVPVPADPTSSDPSLIFAGWTPAVDATMPARNLVYTAKFVSPEPDKYSAKFIVDGNTVDLQILAEGEAIVMPEDPEKFGFKFVGWEPEVPSTMPAEDMEFVAQWEVDKTFITIVVGGTVVAGGIIAGSIIGTNAAWITGVSIVGGILVVVGTAALVKHTHTVTYLVDGEVYKTYLVVEGTKIPVPADPAKDGFEFDGWNPDVPNKMGDTDLTFEAEWTEGNIGADDSDVDVEIPATGSVTGGLAAFAVISGAAAAAYVLTRKKKED